MQTATCYGRAIVSKAAQNLWVWKLYNRVVAADGEFLEPYNPRDGILKSGRNKTWIAAIEAAQNAYFALKKGQAIMRGRPDDD